MLARRVRLHGEESYVSGTRASRFGSFTSLPRLSLIARGLRSTMNCTNQGNQADGSSFSSVFDHRKIRKTDYLLQFHLTILSDYQ